MRIYSPLVASLILAVAASAQSASLPLLKSAGLQADVAILRQAYERLHPGLYRYSDKARMDADFEELRRRLDHDQSLQDAFLAFSEFAAKVRCGHTQANPFNQSKAVVEALFKSPTRVPFYFVWVDRRMIVTHDFTPGHLLPPGTEVRRIDGKPAATILSKLMSIARADGANNAKRIAQLAVTGDSEYETFDLYFPMYFPAKSSAYELQVLRPGSTKSERAAVQALTFAQRIAPIEQRERERKEGSGALFDWKYLPGGEAYLRMPNWALYNSKWEWKGWLAGHLDEAAERRVPALIIDLRGNEGGNDVGDEILAHLIDAPTTLSRMQRLVRYRKVAEELTPYLDTWDKGFLNWGQEAVHLEEPWPTAPHDVPYLKLVREEKERDGKVIAPAGQRFRGRVVVLIDATNSSATFQFAQAIQSNRLGVLVGQSTGGSQRGINGGAFFFLRLPHSGIEMDLPLIGTFPRAPMPDAGISPDVLVNPTAADIAAGRDVVLAAARKAAH